MDQLYCKPLIKKSLGCQVVNLFSSSVDQEDPSNVVSPLTTADSMDYCNETIVDHLSTFLIDKA